ncbi:Phage capsid family protein [compost metagenome]
MEYNISLAHDYNTNQKLEKEALASFIETFKATAENEELRTAFAASLSVPLFQAIEPQTSVRDIFYVDPIPAGALAEYPIDLDDIETAIVMPRLGAVPQNLVVGDSLIVPTFEVANGVEWKLSFVRDGRFNIVERALQKLAKSFVEMEEKAGWDTIRGAIDASNTLTHSETSLSKSLFNDMITEMNAEGLKPEVIYVSPRRAKDIREWTSTTIDPVTQREIFQAGGIASIWNVQLRELRTLSDNEVYLFDTSRLGVMPIRQQLTTYDDPTAIKKLRAGALAWEEIGFAIIDKRGVLKAGF